MTSVLQLAFHARALAPRDLASVIAIDGVLCRHPRPDYFRRRLEAARSEPERHLQIGIDEDGALAAFALGRILEGEFGRSEPSVRLEAFGVQRSAQLHGLGSTLAAAFEEEAVRRGIAEVRTAARWSEHENLRFLEHCGYRLADCHVLDRALQGDAAALAHDLDAEARDAVQPALLQEADLEGIARIDRRHTGRDRREFLRRAVAEALAGSAVRVSLAARIDGEVAGYVMARMDYGDFGRAEPTAVLDTIGVDPLRARQGIGRALLSQLALNLRSLGVERVETVVSAGDLALLGFFYAAGFRPSERLAFVKRLAR
jgi:GNAT superfamily N-acetyltransferase